MQGKYKYKTGKMQARWKCNMYSASAWTSTRQARSRVGGSASASTSTSTRQARCGVGGSATCTVQVPVQVLDRQDAG